MTDIQVSVIIPTYNRAGYLREAIDSVIAQSYRHVEILVVDDGSTDNTRELVHNYTSNIRYIYQENKGPSAARNNGIKNANGHFIAFLDSDDLWHPDKLAKQVAAFIKNPSLGLLATGYENINTSYEMIKEIVLDDSELKHARRKEIYKNFFATSSVMVKKTCFDKVGWFNEELHFAEDWEMWIRILKYYSFDYIPDLLMQYRVHPVKITTHSIQKNIINWRKVIDLHSCNGCFLKDILLKRKRLSWLYLNVACDNIGDDISLRRLFLIKSIVSWPLWFPGRYSALIKSLCWQNVLLQN